MSYSGDEPDPGMAPPPAAAASACQGASESDLGGGPELDVVFAALPDGMAIYDGQGRLVRANPALRRLLALDAYPEFLEAPLRERGARLRIRDPRGRPLPYQRWPHVRVLGGEELSGSSAVETQVTSLDGRVLVLDTTGAPLLDPVGKVVGGLCTTREITDRARLRREGTAAIEGNRMREEFLASAAHDLKTPLASIRGLAQLAQRRLASLTDPGNAVITDMLANIDISVGEMARLIDELLDMSRLQANAGLDLDRRSIDLVALVHAAVTRAQPNAALPIQLEVAATALWASADSDRLSRVVANLLGNAIKYGGYDQPVTVRVCREEEATGPMASIAVTDRGMGIPTADLPRIFDRFYRGTNVVGRIRGTGIGLAVTRQIVEQHQGRIFVESQEGVGSTFIVRLPLTVP